MRSPAPSLVVALLALAAAGCQRGDPLNWVVRAKDSRALASWRAQVDGDLGAENRRRLDQALQEIRNKITADREIRRWMGRPAEDGGKEAVDAVVCQRVHGLPLREVFQLGYELKVARLRQELAALENAVKLNTGLVTAPDDVESRHYLEGLHGRQMARLETYRAELATAEADLAPLLRANGRRMVDVAVDNPDQLPMRVPEPQK